MSSWAWTVDIWNVEWTALPEEEQHWRGQTCTTAGALCPYMRSTGKGSESESESNTEADRNLRKLSNSLNNVYMQTSIEVTTYMYNWLPMKTQPSGFCFCAAMINCCLLHAVHKQKWLGFQINLCKHPVNISTHSAVHTISAKWEMLCKALPSRDPALYRIMLYC